jgi:hypothetical protein
VTGSSRAEHTADTYKAELAFTWTIVGIPVAYGVYNALKATLQLFSG